MMNKDLEQVTFEKMPQAIAKLIEDVALLKDHILNQTIDPIKNEEWLDLEGLRAYHPDKPKPSTIYSWVQKKRISFYKDGKKLRFLRSDVDEILKNGKK